MFNFWGPNLLLGRTFFSADLLLGAYCSVGVSMSPCMPSQLLGRDEQMLVARSQNMQELPTMLGHPKRKGSSARDQLAEGEEQLWNTNLKNELATSHIPRITEFCLFTV